MKNISFTFLIFLTTACIDRLEVEPQQAISAKTALSDPQGIRTAVIGTYDLLLRSPQQTGHVILNSELLADTEDLVWTSFTIPLNQLFNKNIAVGNTTVANFWIYSYQTINQANTVLNALELVNDINQEAVAAELRFIRALVYFDLVNMYALPWTADNPEKNLGVPIISSPSEETLKSPEAPRNTVAEVYQFLIDDLLFAKEHLPTQNGWRISTYAASALLSRVYLMQEEYGLAATEADRVILSGQYELIEDQEQVFNQPDNSAEDIFSLQITSQDGFNGISHFYSGELEGGGGFIGITDKHLTKYRTDDLRANLFYFDQQSGTRRTSKWRLNAANDGNITIFRLAEMYLTRAEGRILTGDEEGALEDLNIIRKRSGLSSLSDINLEIILEERFLELVFEGHQFRDTKRNRKMFGDHPFDDPRLIYPIPQREMDVNRALKQNEGY